MKRSFTSLALSLGLVMTLARCDNSLDVTPVGELTGENFYKTERDFEAASLAPYATLLNYYFDQFGNPWFQAVEYPSDDLRNPAGNNNYEAFNWLANEDNFNQLWALSYKGIARSNVILEKLPTADRFSDPSQKTRFDAEARFMRAYFHFVLVRTFGNVPAVTKSFQTVEETRVPNAGDWSNPESWEPWSVIVEDLTFAAQNLPPSWSGNNVGRATSDAAYALLGKVWLYRAQYARNQSYYQNAISALSQVVQGGRFSLVPNYNDNFKRDTENNDESVFEVQMSTAGEGFVNPWLPVDWPEVNANGAGGTGRQIWTRAACHEGSCAPGANGSGYGQAHVTTSLQNAFEPGDPRKFFTLFSEGDVFIPDQACDGATPCRFKSSWSVTGSTPAKYNRPFQSPPLGFLQNLSTNNERVIRYADVLLMLAEAELLGNNNVARAAELINMVRARARANYEAAYGQAAPAGLLPDRPSGASVDQMFDWLMHERRVELALEGHRYDDLVRWHRAGLINISTDVDFGNATADAAWSERNLLRPIPLYELDNNQNLTQNPNY